MFESSSYTSCLPLIVGICVMLFCVYVLCDVGCFVCLFLCLHNHQTEMVGNVLASGSDLIHMLIYLPLIYLFAFHSQFHQWSYYCSASNSNSLYILRLEFISLIVILV